MLLVFNVKVFVSSSGLECGFVTCHAGDAEFDMIMVATSFFNKIHSCNGSLTGERVSRRMPEAFFPQKL